MGTGLTITLVLLTLLTTANLLLVHLAFRTSKVQSERLNVHWERLELHGALLEEVITPEGNKSRESLQ